jgi:hypothetical protein
MVGRAPLELGAESSFDFKRGRNYFSREFTMAKKSKEAPTAASIKEQLEAIVGHKIDASEQQLAKFSYPIGLFDLWGGWAVSKSVFPFPRKSCSQHLFVDVGGVSSTLPDGKRVFRLSDFICDLFDKRLGFVEPVNVVATPRAERPVFLTVTYAPVPPEPQVTYIPDVQITVFAWGANGAPAPNVEFDWRCRAVGFIAYQEPEPVGG